MFPVSETTRRFAHFVGHCHGCSGLRSPWRFGSQGDDENQATTCFVSVFSSILAPNCQPIEHTPACREGAVSSSRNLSDHQSRPPSHAPNA
jgi:hypothetical protein